MPRIYVPNPRGKRYKKQNKLVLRQAADAVARGMSLREAGRTFDIHFTIIGRYIRKKGAVKQQGGQTSLSEEEEQLIIDRILTCAQWGYPLDMYDLRGLVKDYLDRQGKTIKKFRNNLPGIEFAKSFLRRHNDVLAPRLCQNIKRVRAAVDHEQINIYFDNLTKSLAGVSSGNIINFDETNLSDDPGRKTIITKRGCKYPERVMNSSKSSTSIMFAGSGDGDLLPCYVVYKASNLYDSWVEGGPKGTYYNRSLSGWFDSICFDDWVNKIAVPFLKRKDGKKILIGDNLSSHLSVDSIRICKEHNIDFVFLPSNSTHITQPLDVAFFRPLKTAWRKIVMEWKMGPGRNSATIPKNMFPRLLTKLINAIDTNRMSNLKSGFAKCGIVPLNRQKVLDMLPSNTETVNNNASISDAIDNSLVSFLKSMRYGDTNGKKSQQRKKKIQVAPGKSVTATFSPSSEDESDVPDVPLPLDLPDVPPPVESTDDDSSSSEDIPLSTLKAKNGHVERVETNINDLQIGDWVLVGFSCLNSKASSSKTVKTRDYICKIVAKTNEKEFEGSFLRSRLTRSDKGFVYGYPDVPDIYKFTYEGVIEKLEEPISYGRGLLKFQTNKGL